MSKQGCIGVMAAVIWIVLGIFDVINGTSMTIGLGAFLAGVWLVTWENKDADVEVDE